MVSTVLGGADKSPLAFFLTLHVSPQTSLAIGDYKVLRPYPHRRPAGGSIRGKVFVKALTNNATSMVPSILGTGRLIAMTPARLFGCS